MSNQASKETEVDAFSALNNAAMASAAFFPTASVNQPMLNPEVGQSMTVSAFLALRFSDIKSLPSKSWYFDSGTSNHMTNTTAPLTNLINYTGPLKIHTANGNFLPINAIRNVSSKITNACVTCSIHKPYLCWSIS